MAWRTCSGVVPNLAARDSRSGSTASASATSSTEADPVLERHLARVLGEKRIKDQMRKSIDWRVGILAADARSGADDLELIELDVVLWHGYLTRRSRL